MRGSARGCAAQREQVTATNHGASALISAHSSEHLGEAHERARELAAIGGHAAGSAQQTPSDSSAQPAPVPTRRLQLAPAGHGAASLQSTLSSSLHSTVAAMLIPRFAATESFQ